MSASGQQVAGLRRVDALPASAVSGLHARALFVDAGLGRLVGLEQRLRPARRRSARPAARSSSRGVLGLLVEGQPHAQAELGVVLEQRVGPGRPAALARSTVHGVVGRLPP